MRLFEGTIKDFSEHIHQNRIADVLKSSYQIQCGKNPSDSEYRSWQQSLVILNNSFHHSLLVSNWLIIEYQLPFSSRRIDVLIFGKSVHKEDTVVLMELKQWSNDSVEDCEVEGNVLVDYGKFREERPHPSLQVEGYHFDLMDFLKIFDDRDKPSLNSCVYCHNYSKFAGKRVLFLNKFNKQMRTFPIFAKEDAVDLGNYLKEKLLNSNGFEVYNRFINSDVKPSKRLLDHTSEMLNKQQIFTLIDNQIAAYNGIMHKVKQQLRTQKKSIVIVKGGPGTGKSVIALEVMAELMRQGKVVYHATGSSAFTNTLRKIVGRRANGLFKFFFSFTKAAPNSIDVLICDEAHRIRANSNDYGVPFSLRSKNPQIEDLIKPAKLTIFFIDEHQVVRPKEIGSVDLIKKYAVDSEIAKEDILEYELKTQFRCSGSDAYLQWLDDVLAIRETEIKEFDYKMSFHICESPAELRRMIDQKNNDKPNSARITAGFCWPWSAPRSDGSLVNDVKIGNFEMPWEPKNKFWQWATYASGMNQVGTVYTAQGFEFDYIGVIFGNDLVYDPSLKEWRSVSENSCDSQLIRNNERLVKHLKNVYRVLLSRAHKGVFIYFMDKSTEVYFKKRLGIQQGIAEKPLYVDEFLNNLTLVENVPESQKYIDYIPVFSLKAIASGFGESGKVEVLGWKKIDFHIKGAKDYFVAQVKGKSMEPTIKDGDYCLFRKERGGSRNGLVVLVESKKVKDPETEHSFTIKRYLSEKDFFSDGTWRHKKITLDPDNKEFSPIILENVDPNDFKIIAEFIRVL